MERINLPEDATKGYPDDYTEATRYFVDGLKILAKIIVREISQESVNSEKHVSKGQNYRSGAAGFLQDEGKLALSVSEVSKLLGLSRNVTYELIRTSQIPSVKFGRRILVPRIKLEMALS